MKLYTFLDENDKRIEQVIAENHDEAIAKAGSDINFQTDFYWEDDADEWQPDRMYQIQYAHACGYAD